MVTNLGNNTNENFCTGISLVQGSCDFFSFLFMFLYNSHKYFSFVGYKTLQLFFTYGTGILVIAIQCTFQYQNTFLSLIYY